MAVSSFQLAHRVRRARSLLEAGVPISEVAQRAGFADQSHFHRHFRRTLGMTPARYVRALRSDVQDEPALPTWHRRTMKITPHIVVPEAASASEWYQRAFGAVERTRVPLPGGKVMTLELVVGDSHLHVASEFPAAGIVSPLAIGGTATVLQLEVSDARAVWARALAAGATVHHELAEQFWGELHGQIVDPFGHRWNVAQRLRDVPADEIAAAAARLFAGPSS